MKLSLFAASILALAGGHPALSQTFLGGTAGVGYDEFNSDTGPSYTSTRIDGSFVFDLKGPFSVQGDLASWDYDYRSSSVTSLGVHLIYELSPTVTAGAFVNREDWDTTFTQYGLEFKTSLARGRYPVALSGFLLEGDNSQSTDPYTVIGVRAAVPVTPQVSVIGSYAAASDSYDVQVLSATGRYGFGNGLYGELTLRAFSGDDSATSLGIGLGYDFGKGASFAQHNWYDALGGY